MNNVWKKILPVILMVWPYLAVVLLVAGSMNGDGSYAIIGVCTGLTMVIYIMNIINACMYKGENACYELAKWNAIIKVVHIPFYICVFLLGVFFFLATALPAMLFISPVFIILLWVIDVFLMITSSIYGVSALIKAKKQGMITRENMIVHGILHFFFMADVVSALIVYAKLRKLRKNPKPSCKSA